MTTFSSGAANWSRWQGSSVAPVVVEVDEVGDHLDALLGDVEAVHGLSLEELGDTAVSRRTSLWRSG
jgi:hypothetical protein